MQMEKLNEYPQPAVLGAEGRLLAMNEKAAALFRGMEAGEELPAVICVPEGNWEGSVTLEGRLYRVAATLQGEQTLYLLQPLEQQALAEGQLDGALYQMRTLMGDFRRELATYAAGEREQFAPGDLEDFTRSYYRMLRLMDHMDLLRDAAAGQLTPARERLDLDRLCAVTAMECGGLLGEIGIRVEYTGPAAGVYVSGDGEKLRDALLELISNCARRRRKGGVLKLALKRSGTWARICVTDDGDAPTAREKLGLTGRGAVPLIPAPDGGAGLGLSAAEAIVRVHGGALMVSTGEGAPSVYLALPVVERTGESVSLRTPGPERNAGMNPYLIALSDILPGEMIREDWKQ